MQRDTSQKNVDAENVNNKVSSSNGQITKRSSKLVYGKQANKQEPEKMFWLTQNTSLIFFFMNTMH